MPNEIVKYKPELNTIPLRKFTPVEMNLFFSIVAKMRDKDTQIVKFTFENLKYLSDYKQTAGAIFVKDLTRTYDHLMDLRFGRRSESGLTVERFVMFTDFEIHGDVAEPYVNISIHKKALPLLNHLESWVRYSLKEFRELNSSYAKTMFRLLKQYRTNGWMEFSKVDFFELLDIPSSYLNQPANVDKRVLKPIKEELSPLFQGLTIKKKYGKGRGTPLVGYRFTWKKEDKNADDFSQGAYADRSKKLQNIKHNSELSYEEKKAATLRIIDKVELDKLPDFLNPLLETPEEKKRRLAKNHARRSKLANKMLNFQVREKCGLLTADEQKQLLSLEKQYARITKQD